MNNDDVKSANRKALPRFILLTLISTVIGGAVGYFSAKYGLDAMSSGIKSAVEFFGANMAPWLMAASAATGERDARPFPSHPFLFYA